MERDIGALNEEMDAAGARIFAGGLSPASNAKSLRAQPDGKVMDHRRAVPGDQGARRRFLDPESRKPRRGAGVGAQSGHRLPGTGRSAPVPPNQASTEGG